MSVCALPQSQSVRLAPRRDRRALPPRSPPGGYTKPPSFPDTGFRKRSPVRGPAGAVIGLGALGLMAWGWYRLVESVEERKCVRAPGALAR